MTRPFAALMRIQMLASTRSFPSVFYTIVLPAILFVIFGLVFNVNGDYARFFLPGMIGVMGSSDALFAVGPVIKEYFRQGIVREFRTYPFPLVWLFVSFILMRLVFIIFSAALLVSISVILFGFVPTPVDLVRYVVALGVGFSAYSFIALSISFRGIADNRDQGFISLYYFLGMFLSDAYMKLSDRVPALGMIGYAFPLKPVLQFMRGNNAALIPCMAWLVVSGGAFALLIRSMQLQRR